MVARKFRLSEEADLDLDSIWAYIAPDDVTAASNLIDRITEAFDFLAETPFAGRARPDIGADLRSFVVRGYTVFYIPGSRGIEILRVLHNKRDVTAKDVKP